MVVFRASNPPWRRMGCRGVWHPAAIPCFKRTVKARGKVSWRGKDTQTEEARWAEKEHRSCRDYSNLVCPGHMGHSQVLLRGIVHVPDHEEGGAEGNNPQTVPEWLPTHFDKPKWEDTSHYAPRGLNTRWALNSAGISSLKVTSWRWLS